VTSQREASSVVEEGRRLACDKGKRKVVNSIETEKSYNFKADPLVLKETLEIEAKR